MISEKVIVLVAVGAGLFMLEWLFDFRERKEGRARHVVRNLSFALVTGLFIGIFYTRILTWASEIVLQYDLGFVQFGLLPAWLEVIVLFLLFDGALYFWHRANHALPFLWRFHRVHHSDRDLDFSSAVRFHAGELFLSILVKAAFILMTGASLWLVVFFDVVVTIAALFNHSNLFLGRAEPWIRKIIVTPSMHRVHHSQVPRETDTNFTTILSVWDYLFRTFLFRSHQKNIKIGLREYGEKKPLTISALFTMPLNSSPQREYRK